MWASGAKRVASTSSWLHLRHQPDRHEAPTDQVLLQDMTRTLRGILFCRIVNARIKVRGRDRATTPSPDRQLEAGAVG